MWVKMCSIASGPSFTHHVHDVVNVDDETGKEWIKSGHAVAASEPSRPAASAPAQDETASVDGGEKATNPDSLINKLRGGNAKPKAPKTPEA